MDDLERTAIEALHAPLVQQALQAAHIAQEFVKQVDGVWRGLAEALATRTREIADAINGAFTSAPVLEALREWQRIVDELPPRTRALYQRLVDNGWYPDQSGMTLPDIERYAALLSQGEIAEADSVLTAHFNERVEDIVDAIVREFPDRTNPLRDAMAAHREGKFTLSVPVLLAQADGICVEVLEEELYRSSNGKLLIAEIAARWMDPDALADVILFPLTLSSPVSSGRNQRTKGGFLYRHAVLHGEDSAYGTELIGCRALSLLNGVFEASLRIRERKRVANRADRGAP